MRILFKHVGLAIALIAASTSMQVRAQDADAPESETSALTRGVPPIDRMKISRSSLVEVLSRAAGVPVRVAWDGDLQADSEVDAHLNGCTVDAALITLLDREPFIANHEIAVGDTNANGPVFIERYAIGDVIRGIAPWPGEAVERLVRLIESAVDTDSWKDNGGAIGELVINGNAMTVAHHLVGQHGVRQLLKLLREPTPPLTEDALKSSLTVLEHRINEGHFSHVPIRQIIAALAKDSRANIIVNANSLETSGIDLDSPWTIDLTGMKLRQALSELLWSVGGNSVDYDFQNGVIRIATVDAMHRYTDLRLYDVEPLMRRMTAPPIEPHQPGAAPPVTRQYAMDAITKLIEDNVATESWRDNGGAVGSIFDLGDRVLIRQTPQGQQQAAALLTVLSQAVATQPASEPAPPPPLKIPTTSIGDLDFDGTRLQDALERIASRSNLQVIVNWKALQQAGVGPDTPVRVRLPDATVRAAIAVVLALVQDKELLAATIDADQVIHISTVASEGNAIEIRLYHIQPLIDAILRQSVPDPNAPRQSGLTEQDAVDSITKLIEDNIDTESWKDNGGAVSSLRVFMDVLIVTAKPETHAKLDALLKKMKKETVTRNLPEATR